MSDLVERDLTDEEYREYDFGGRVFRIVNPVKLFFRVGGSTHRVVDEFGMVHCLPGPGYHGCALRWKPRNPSAPVAF